MFNGIGTKILIAALLPVIVMLTGASTPSAQPSEKSVSGTLSAQSDREKGTVTAMFVGYSEGSPVVIGPYSWDMSQEEFSRATAMDIGKKLLGPGHSIRKVIKCANSGKELIANIIIGSRPAPLVGR